MRTLVTGGAGFIGANLVRRLLELNHEVVVVDDLRSGFEENLTEVPVRFVRGSVADRSLMNELCKGVEVVFHLAASVGNKRSIDQPFEDAETNVMGTLSVLEAMRNNRVPKLVISSSAGIFGELQTVPIREDHPIEPDTPYGSTKLCAEKLSLSYGKLYGVSVTALRYFNVYGRFQRFDAYGNVIPIFAFKAMRGEDITVFGDGAQTRDFVNVDDVVQANVLSSQSTESRGAFNIGSGTRIDILSLARLVLKGSGSRSRIVFGSSRPGDVRDSMADISKAQQSFGYRPSVSLDTGLADYLSWVRKHVMTQDTAAV